MHHILDLIQAFFTGVLVAFLLYYIPYLVVKGISDGWFKGKKEHDPRFL